MSTAPELPAKPKKSRTTLWVILAVLAAAAIALAAIFIPRLLGGNANAAEAPAPEASADAPATATPTEQTVVKLGTTDASQGHWPVLQELLAEENITLELVPFAEYPLPNPALASGEIDLNAFQHIDYLSNHNVATGDALAVVGPTLIVPLPIYSNEYTDVAAIPEGSKIAVPNDATNQARALKVLQAAGLIELDAAASVPTPSDVKAGKVEVVAVEASQTAAALNDPQIAGAVVNNNFATDAGILNKAIFSVDPSDANSWPYINIIASRAGEEDNPIFQKVWEKYHDPRVTEIVVKESGATAVIVTEPTAQVREWLAQVEAEKQAAQ